MITETFMWLLGAYVAGSIATYYLFFKHKVTQITEMTLDSLISQGYIKTKGTGNQMEIIKWQDWCCDDQTSG
jgi:hypothetical protein